MAIDYEVLRQQRQQAADAARKSDWAERERLAVEAMRTDHARQREAEQHQRELSEFATFAARKSEAARNGDDARTWAAAASNARDGKWTVARLISADPEIMRFGPLRTRLNYEGSNVQL